jgi:CRISPR type IV-associated protein Csf2
MSTLLLDGTFTAVSPIAIILPGSEDKRTPAGAPRKRMFRDGLAVETIYIPPSSLRGRLRHLLTTEVMRLQNAADGRIFTPDDYIDTALGGVKDRKTDGEDERKLDLKAIRELRERNPILSLFGSMVSHISGRLMVGDMTPLEPIAPANAGRSVRANPFVRNPTVIGLLDPACFDEFERLNNLRTAANRAEDEADRLKPQLSRLKRSGGAVAEVQKMETSIAELTKQSEIGFKEAGGAVNIQQLLDGYDVVPEGTVMTNRIRLIEGTDVEMTMLLMALDLLAKRPLIGGHTAHGCGEIAGSWRARIPDNDGLHDAGTLRLEPFAGLTLEGASPQLEALYERSVSFSNEVLKYDFGAA